MLGRILLLLVIQLAKQGLIHARPSHDPRQIGQCPSTGLPSGGLRQVNVIHDGKPRYRLDLQQTRSGYVPGHTYTISVRAQDLSQTFGDILLSVSSESRTCPHGNFSIQSQHYYQPEGCDHMVLKNTREFEHAFTFQWTAPTCGCVILRARVESVNNIYYLDNENVIDGYLTKHVCRRHMSTILSKISHSEREDLLCHVVSSSDDQMANEDHFLRRRKMDPTQMTVLERDAFHILLRQRIYQVQQCCVQMGTAKTDCLGDIRRHRIDQLCANTQYLPFTVRGDAYMTERRDNCCWRLGERRYDCFAMGRQGEGVPPQSDVDVAMVAGDNVLDECDPVNDLEDYPNRLSEELVQLQTQRDELASDEKAVAAVTGDVHRQHLVPTSHVHKEAQKQPVLPIHKTGQHAYKPVTGQEAYEPVTSQQAYEPVAEEISPLQRPRLEDLTKMSSTPQTRPLTQTTQGLEKKLLRVQVELECCQQGKEYGAGLVTRDSWDRCEQRTRKVTKAKRGKERRWCRRYHLRCCVESAHSLVNGHRWMSSMKPITSYLVSINSLLHSHQKVSPRNRKTFLKLRQLGTRALQKAKKLHILKIFSPTELYLEKEFHQWKLIKNQTVLKIFTKIPTESNHVTDKIAESGHGSMVHPYGSNLHASYRETPPLPMPGGQHSLKSHNLKIVNIELDFSSTLPATEEDDSRAHDRNHGDQETRKSGQQRSEEQVRRKSGDQRSDDQVTRKSGDQRSEDQVTRKSGDQSPSVKVRNEGIQVDSGNIKEVTGITDSSTETTMVTAVEEGDEGADEDESMDDSEETRKRNVKDGDPDREENIDVEDEETSEEEDDDDTRVGQRSVSDDSESDGQTTSSTVVSRVNRIGDQPQGSVDQDLSDLSTSDQSSDNQLAQDSDHNNDPQPVEAMEPSSDQQQTVEPSSGGKLKRRRQRKSRRKGRKNRRRGRKQIST